MNQQQLEKEYCEFVEKWFEKIQEFSRDFDKLSCENERKFQVAVAKSMPAGMLNILDFLNTKF